MTPGSESLPVLQEEIDEVRRLLLATLNDLQSPLNELVRSQLGRTYPSIRAAIVLSAGFAEPDNEEHQRQRICLAAALEMLHVALQVHHLLVTASLHHDESRLDASLIGSTILAGDYCFSRSAQLAAKTDSPHVVELFAEALQVLSEERLRYLFGQAQAPFDDQEELLRTGTKAAVELARLSPSARTEVLQLAMQMSASTENGATSPTLFVPVSIAHLSPAQQARWQALCQWLDECR
jgi:octaprenyl-diphosphate synthase